MHNYALEPMLGTANGEKVKPSLEELAQGYKNPAVTLAVVEVAGERLDALQKEIGNRLEYRGPRSLREKLLEGVPASFSERVARGGSSELTR